MGTINVTRQTGERLSLAATEGHNLMEILRDGGVDEIVALCGGFASCGTCHVDIHADDMDRLLSPDEDEDEMLDSVDNRAETSRLSCQIPYTLVLDGLRVTIPQTS